MKTNSNDHIFKQLASCYLTKEKEKEIGGGGGGGAASSSCRRAVG